MTFKEAVINFGAQIVVVGAGAHIAYSSDFQVSMNKSCHTYEWVTPRIWMGHEWVLSHIWMSHVTHMNESCHTYEWVMSHIWVSHVTHMNEPTHRFHLKLPGVTWLRHKCDMAHHMCDMTHHGLLIRVTWLIHMHDMTHLNVWHDSLMCDIFHLYVWHETSLHSRHPAVTWFICTCDTTYLWNSSFLCVTWLIHTYDMTRP